MGDTFQPPPGGWDPVVGTTTSAVEASNISKVDVVPAMLGSKGGLKGVYDLYVDDHRAFLRRVGQMRGDTIGAIVGFVAACGVLGAVIGSIIGRTVARNNAQQRVQAAATGVLTPGSPGSPGSPGMPGTPGKTDDIVLDPATVTAAELRETTDGGKAVIRTSDGTTRRLRWSKSITKPIDVRAVFERAAPGRVTFTPLSAARKALYWAGVALILVVALLIVFYIVIGLFGGDDDTDTSADAARQAGIESGIDPDAIAPLQRACGRWITLTTDEATPDRVQAVVADVRVPLAEAGAADASLQHAADSANRLHAFFTQTPEAPVELSEEEARAALGTIDTACNRLVPG